MNIKHMFANAIVRRVAYVLVAAVLAWVGIGKAQAADIAPCLTTASPLCTKGEAHTVINNYVTKANTCTSGGEANWTELARETTLSGGGSAVSATSGRLAVRISCIRTSDQFTTWFTNSNNTYFGSGCPAGQDYDPVLGCKVGCSGKPSITNKSYSGGSGVCFESCTYAADIGGVGSTNKFYVLNAGTPNATSFASVMSPTGGACTVGSPSLKTFDPNKAVCSSTGGSHSECIRPDGKHCVTGSKGSTLCWDPGEEGAKNTADGEYSADKKKAPGVPTAPASITNPTTISTTSTTNGGDTFNTTTFSGTGTNGGQSNTGTGGTDTGAGGGSGDGEDGNGYGSASGDASLSRFAGAEGRTVSSVVEAHKARMALAPLVAASYGFFTVTAGGACPTWTLPNTDWSPSIEMNFWCRSELSSAWTMVGVIMLIVFGWAAFRIAML